MPKKIADAPQLSLGLELYYEAFWELSTARPTGWGLGPIPWGAVDLYASQAELDAEQRDDLHYYVRAMDNAFLKYQKDHAPRLKKEAN